MEESLRSLTRTEAFHFLADSSYFTFRKMIAKV